MTTSSAQPRAAAKARPWQQALRSPHLVAGGPEGARGVAAALLTAGAAGEPPRVRRAAVAGLPHHVGEAPALPCGRLAPAALRALAVLPDSAQVVADALCEGKNMAPPCQPDRWLPNRPEFAFSLFSESPEERADVGTSQCPWVGLADPVLNDIQHRIRAIPMSQAGQLSTFCPGTQEAAGAPHSSLAFLLLSSLCAQPKPKPTRLLTAGCGGRSAWSSRWHAKQSRAPVTHPATRLPCRAASSTEGEEGLPPHHPVRLPPAVRPHLQEGWCKQKANPHPAIHPPSLEKK